MTENRDRQEPRPQDDPRKGRSIPRGTDEHADPQAPPASDDAPQKKQTSKRSDPN